MLPSNRVEAMKFHVLAESIGAGTMGLPDSRKSPVSREFPEIVNYFPRTTGGSDIKMDVSSHIETVVLMSRVKD